jgi:hypothetical protein
MKYAVLAGAILGGSLLVAGPAAEAQNIGVLRQAYLDCVKQTAEVNVKYGIGGAAGVTEADKLDCACTIGAGAVQRQLRRKFSDEKLELTSGICRRAYRDALSR